MGGGDLLAAFVVAATMAEWCSAGCMNSADCMVRRRQDRWCMRRSNDWTRRPQPLPHFRIAALPLRRHEPVERRQGLGRRMACQVWLFGSGHELQCRSDDGTAVAHAVAAHALPARSPQPSQRALWLKHTRTHPTCHKLHVRVGSEIIQMQQAQLQLLGNEATQQPQPLHHLQRHQQQPQRQPSVLCSMVCARG